MSVKLIVRLRFLEAKHFAVFVYRPRYGNRFKFGFLQAAFDGTVNIMPRINLWAFRGLLSSFSDIQGFFRRTRLF